MDALQMTLLFDYYGDLLTERQRMCIDMRYNQDMSLGEIAQELQVSRQGVYDNLNRAEALLTNMEQKTGCVRRICSAGRYCEPSKRLPRGRRNTRIPRFGRPPPKSRPQAKDLRGNLRHLEG